MRNLCVILADQLNQEISSLNDFNKDLDDILEADVRKSKFSFKDEELFQNIVGM